MRRPVGGQSANSRPNLSPGRHLLCYFFDTLCLFYQLSTTAASVFSCPLHSDSSTQGAIYWSLLGSFRPWGAEFRALRRHKVWPRKRP